MDINYLTVPGGPLKVGPFSHAVRAGDFLFITGQMPTLKNDNSKQNKIFRLIHKHIKNENRRIIKKSNNLI